MVGVTDLRSGEDGLEVNMNNVMDQIQSLLAQYVIRRKVKTDLPSYKVAWDGGGKGIWGDARVLCVGFLNYRG